MKKDPRKLDLSNTEQIKEFFKHSKDIQVNSDVDREVRSRIITFAKNMEKIKKKDYGNSRKPFSLTYKFGRKPLKEDDPNASIKKSISQYLRKNPMHYEVVDHSDKFGRGK